MSMVNIALPGTLKSFVDDQIGVRGYSTPSEYIPELTRMDQDRQRSAACFLDGAASPPTTTADADYLDQLRDACPHGKAHAADGGETRWLGGGDGAP